jgi:hypothetical protein
VPRSVRIPPSQPRVSATNAAIAKFRPAHAGAMMNVAARSTQPTPASYTKWPPLTPETRRAVGARIQPRSSAVAAR